MTDYILPPESGQAERALAEGVRAAFGFPVPLRDLWDPWRCPLPVLGWLAYALSVDTWDDTWTEATKRAVVAASIEVHRHKGSVWAVRQAIAAAGYGDATLVERFGQRTYDGGHLHDGSVNHAPADHWAEFRLILTRPITNEQAATVRRILAAVAPARCHLKQLDFTGVPHVENAAILHDGTYNHGAS